MPEGPSILAIKETLEYLQGKTIVEAYGYAPMDKDFLFNQKIVAVDAFGKNLILAVKDNFITMHLGLFGNIEINKRKKVNASFGFRTASDEVNGYVVKVKKYTGWPDDHFDRRTDIMSEQYDKKYVLKLVKEVHTAEQIGDVLMNQAVFTGVGNIIRNEVLYRCKVRPESIVAGIPLPILRKIIKDAQTYGWLFYKRMYTHSVSKEAQIYGKDACAVHDAPPRVYISGKAKRKNYVCEACQQLYV